MTLLDKAARKFVEEVSDSLAVLSSTKTEPPPLPVLFTPMLLVSILILSRSAVNTYILLAAATSSAPLLVALMRHRGGYYYRSLAKTGVMVVAFSAIVAAPLLVTSPGAFTSFIERVSVLTLELIAVTGVIGWSALLVSLECIGVPSELVQAIELMTRLIPLLSLDALRFIEARRARSLGEQGARKTWHVLATALSVLLEKSYERGHRLSLAIRARRLGTQSPTRSRRCLSRGSFLGALAYLPLISSIVSYVVARFA